MSYVDTFIAAVPAANKEAYRKHTAEFATFMRDLGATRLVENWGDDVPAGKETDFQGAVQATADEVVVFSWLEYPDKAVRDAANQKMMTDPRMQSMQMPFDGKRMIYGGFAPIVDLGVAAASPGYVDGSLVPVPRSAEAGYRALAAQQAAVLMELGATRVVQAWGDDVPDGKVTDCKRAVKATGDEAVVASWIEWPSKAVRDAAWPEVMADPRMHAGAVGYDEGRRIHGGFAPLLTRT